MGCVYEAHDKSTGQRVAVKVISSRHLSPGNDAVRRFRREARAAGSIDSEHIVRVLDAGTDKATGQLYLAMELLEGEDLQKLIDRAGALDASSSLRIAAQALEGLKKAHEGQIVHRDIKPANIFLARGPGGAITVKLLDFGIAKVKNDPLGVHQSTGLTTTGGLLGSPLYMSPEQIQSSRDVDFRTDVWSLGSALYCMLAGRAPHQHVTSVGKLIIAICSWPAPPLEKVAPWVDPEIAKVVERAVKIRLEERYPGSSEMLEAIRALLPDGLALSERSIVHLGKKVTEVSTSALAAGLGSTDLQIPIDPYPAGERAEYEITETAPGHDDDEEEVVHPRLEIARRPHESPRVVGGVIARARPRPRAPWVAGVLLATVLVGGWIYVAVSASTARPERALARGTDALGATSELLARIQTGGASSAPPVTPAPDAPRRVKLVVSPADASVEIDGARADVTDGVVEIGGLLMSTHRVRVFKGGSDVVSDVRIMDNGAEPAQITLTVSKRAGQSGKAGAGASAAPAVASALLSSKPPPAPENVLIPDQIP